MLGGCWEDKACPRLVHMLVFCHISGLPGRMCFHADVTVVFPCQVLHAILRVAVPNLHGNVWVQTVAFFNNFTTPAKPNTGQAWPIFSHLWPCTSLAQVGAKVEGRVVRKDMGGAYVLVRGAAKKLYGYVQAGQYDQLPYVS